MARFHTRQYKALRKRMAVRSITYIHRATNAMKLAVAPFLVHAAFEIGE